MARLVYACRFDVVARDGLTNVLLTYQDWIIRHYRTRRQIDNFQFDPYVAASHDGIPEDHSLSSINYRIDDEHVVRLRWSFPDDHDNGLRWVNEIRVGQFGNRCGVEHLISIESVEYSISPARLLVGSPHAVRKICTTTSAYIGEMQVIAEPYTLQQNSLVDLLELLTSDLRRLPVVVLSPYARGDLNPIDATKLARNLAGVAVVVRIDDPEVTWDFADEIGRQLSCFNGAARIYWPGFSRASDSRSHRLYFGAWIEQVGPEVAVRSIERSIFAVAAFRYVPDVRIADLIRRAEAAERQRLLSKKKETGDDFWAEYERDLARLDEAEQRLKELEAEIANLRANQQVYFETDSGNSDELGPAEEAEELSIASVSDAAYAARKKCTNIEILESAISGAADSPFQRPYDVYKALTDLDEIVDDWKENRDKKGSGGDLLQHLRNRGWGKRSSMHISDTTRGKYRTYYEFDYQGKKMLFEPHITIGAGDPNSCASIHFIFDQDRLKIIVAHVGKHLPNTRS